MNAVAPGVTRTDRNQFPGLDETIADVVPLGRIGTQEEIAKAVVFLASDLASFITGQTLIADGGARQNMSLAAKLA